MIRSLAIQNIQSWEEVYLEFLPGLNVLIGPTDAGKSAIMRALKRIITNRPMGDDLLSHWGGESLITLDLMENFLVTWGRTKSKSYYAITDADGNEQVFQAVGHHMPPEVIQLLNFAPLNRQEQLEGPFLLASSPGEVARYLNQVVDLEEIDTGLSNIGRVIRQEERALETHLRALTDLEEDLAKYDWLERAEEDLVKWETFEQGFNDALRKHHSLQNFVADIESRELELADQKVLLEAGPQVDALLELTAVIDNTVGEYNDLHITVEMIKHKDNQLFDAKSLLTAKPEVDALIDLSDEIKIAKKDRSDLHQLMIQLKTKETQLANAKQILDEIEKEYHEIMSDTCPLCGQEVG
jgi:DNA repair exonuclease SbcCD ATPase subunit